MNKKIPKAKKLCPHCHRTLVADTGTRKIGKCGRLREYHKKCANKVKDNADR